MDRDLTEFLARPIMLIAAVRAADGRALIARSMGVRPTPDGTALDLFISRAQWMETVDEMEAGAWLALTLCRPETYETYQLKGPIEAPALPSAADRAFADAYVGGISDYLLALGVRAEQMSPWLTTADVVRVRLRPERLFQQTPGPGAGARLESRL